VSNKGTPDFDQAIAIYRFLPHQLAGALGALRPPAFAPEPTEVEFDLPGVGRLEVTDLQFDDESPQLAMTREPHRAAQGQFTEPHRDSSRKSLV
jgi:hypothetical protein